MSPITEMREYPWFNGYIAGLWKHSKQVQSPVVLLCSFLDKYPYPPRYMLNSTTTVLQEG